MFQCGNFTSVCLTCRRNRRLLFANRLRYVEKTLERNFKDRDIKI